jgi:hypothetical protein
MTPKWSRFVASESTLPDVEHDRPGGGDEVSAECRPIDPIDPAKAEDRGGHGRTG